MDRSHRNAPTIFLAGCLFILLVVAIQMWPGVGGPRGQTRSLDGIEQWALAGSNILPSDNNGTPIAALALADDASNEATPHLSVAGPRQFGATVQASNALSPANSQQKLSWRDPNALARNGTVGQPTTDISIQAPLPSLTDMPDLGTKSVKTTDRSDSNPSGSGPSRRSNSLNHRQRLEGENRPAREEQTATERSIQAEDPLQLSHEFTGLEEASLALQRSDVIAVPEQQAAITPDPFTAQSVISPWPHVPALRDRLSNQSAPWSESWAQQVTSQLDQLQQQSHLESSQSKEILVRLSRLISKADKAARSMQRPKVQTELRRATYALARRVALWEQVNRNANPALHDQLTNFAAAMQPDRMTAILAQVEEALAPRPESWHRFLAIHHVRDVATSSSFHEASVRADLATKLLSRIANTTFDSDQQQIVGQPVIARFQKELRRWVTNTIDLRGLLSGMEEYELDPNGERGARVTATWNRLKWSLSPAQQKLSQAIDTHYRNANVRFAVTEEFINRLVPAIQDVQAPVRERILGADVRGQSSTSTKFRIDLLPDPSSIRMHLEGLGHMSANTQSTKDGVTLLNRNRARFIVQKLLLMDTRGLRIGRAQAAAIGSSNLTGLRTRFDSMPFVGSIVRRAAQRQASELRNKAETEFATRVASQAKSQMDQQLQQQVAQAQQRLSDRFIKPMEDLNLNPTALAMKSTNDRMTLRSRLASDDQLASFTARPEARSDSLLSVQVHESALNNFVSQLNLERREGDLKDVIRDVAKIAGMGEITIPDEVPDGVKIRLADRDPLRFQFHEGRIRMDIRIAGLKYERRIWKNFEVRAYYVPKVKGFSCDLHRDGYIELIGPMRTRHQVALRGIFGKVLSKNRPITLIHPELAKDKRLAMLIVSQFIVRDGWVGASVGRQEKARQPERQAKERSPQNQGKMNR